jgi:hypothetical protein
MKIYSIFLSLLTLGMLVACSGDDADSGNATVTGGGADVALTVTAREANTTGIATRAFDDANATDGEMMKNYIIIAVNQTTGKITHILQSGSLATEKETDTYTDKVHFDSGTYTFYTFANLTLDQLGLSTAKVGDDAPDFDNKTLAVDGNQTSVTAFTSGIPMSNKQTDVVIDAHTPGVGLYVFRMVAKMTLRLTNATGSAMTLNSITLSDITKNASEVTASDGTTRVPNLYLLPTTATDSNGKDYCTPRLTTAFSSTADASSYSGYSSYSLYSDYTITLSKALSIRANNSAKPAELTFYVNESAAHDPANFQLSLNLTTTQTDGSTQSGVARYTILNWSAIGRNDYRVIPITIDDYKLTFDVQYFTAIGVLPPTVTDDGQNLDLGFSYYGEIHLVPKVKKWSDGSDVTATLHPTYTTSPWTLVSGSNATGFFATAPYWSSSNKWVEASIGFTAGTSAVYRLRCTITKADGTQQTLSRNVRFKMTPMSLGAKAGTRSASTDGSTIGWHWITASESLNHNK